MKRNLKKPVLYLNSAAQKKEPKSSRVKTAAGARVLVKGLAQLTEGQRCFADEFGMNYRRVFSDAYEPFKGEDPEKVIRQWLLEGEEGAERLQLLLDALVQHQLAMVGALEGIADETLSQLSPIIVERSSPGFLGLRPFRWRTYRSLHRRYAQDRQWRLKNLVIGGFVSGYLREREKKSK